MKLLKSAYAAIDELAFASPDEQPALTAAYERRFAAYATAYRQDAQTKDIPMTPIDDSLPFDGPIQDDSQDARRVIYNADGTYDIDDGNYANIDIPVTVIRVSDDDSGHVKPGSGFISGWRDSRDIDDEADLRRAEYGTHAYDGWDHSDEERVIAMMGAEAKAPEVKTVKCRACNGQGWHWNVDAGFRCKTCEGTGKVPATTAAKFAVGDTVTYGPWTGTVQEIDDYDPTHMRVLYLAEREAWLNDYQLKPVVKAAPAVSPVLEALRKIDIDSLSPMDAMTKLMELKRLAGKA